MSETAKYIVVEDKRAIGATEPLWRAISEPLDGDAAAALIKKRWNMGRNVRRVPIAPPAELAPAGEVVAYRPRRPAA